MDENPYRAPRGQGATLSRRFRFSLERPIVAIAMVASGIGIFYGAWQVGTQDLLVLLGALFCIAVMGALFGGALAVVLNPPTSLRNLVVAVGGTIASLVAFGAWVFTR
ncbi:MAG TPA: hypothetical protein VHC22_23400 [Pirellulales bacterium]|nr:hypothetical protein [Pirellulales bacterium]